MGSSSQEIQCRKCRESIPADADNCPNCGTSVRSMTAPLAGIVLGLVLVVASLSNLGQLWFYGLLGGLLVAIGAGLLYDKRQRSMTAETAP